MTTVSMTKKRILQQVEKSKRGRRLIRRITIGLIEIIEKLIAPIASVAH